MQAGFAGDEGEGEFVFGVGVVLVRGFEDGVAAQVPDRVHGQHKVLQVVEVFEQG
jgi:hypothetical protein